MKDLGPFRGFSPETLVSFSPSFNSVVEKANEEKSIEKLTLPLLPAPHNPTPSFSFFPVHPASPLSFQHKSPTLLVSLLSLRSRFRTEQRARIAHLQTLDSTFSLSVLSGVLTEDHENFDKEKYYGSQARAQGQFDFIKDVAQWIPDFVAVLSIHDVPTQFVSWNHLEELRALDEEGECELISFGSGV